MTTDDDIFEIEQELGINPSGVYSNVRARFDILEARINNPLAPAPDVDNPFFIGNTGVTISTGVGSPSENRVDGSIYLRQDGYGIYSRQNSQWELETSSGGGTVGPAGPAGTDGSPGYSAFALTGFNFIQPSIGFTTSVTLGGQYTTAWISVGSIVYIGGGGYYQVTSVSNQFSFTVQNLGYSNNTSPGLTINSGNIVAPAGIVGATGQGAFTITTSSYVQPNVNSGVDVNVENSSWLSEASIIFIMGAGYYVVDTVYSSTSIAIVNLGYIGPNFYTFPTPGLTISAGASVTAAASQGIDALVFSNVSSMMNFDSTYLSDGAEVRVTYPRSMKCTLDKNSTITPDNLRYFSATPTGVWIRDAVTGCLGASEVAEWFISPSGDDNNDGVTDVTPLQNIEEFQYRIGQQAIDGNTVGTVFVTLLGDYNSGIEYSFDFNFIHSGSVAFLGQKNVQATYTISAVTPWNETTGVIGAYSLTGSPNLSSNVGMFARISASTNPSAIGRKTLIVKTPSTGVFNGNFIDQTTTLVAEPIVGDTIQIYTMTKLGGNVIVNNSPTVFNSGGGVYFQDLDIGIVGANHSFTIGSGSVFCVACILRGCDVQPGVNQLSLSICATYDLRAYSFLTMYGTIMQSAGGALLDVRGNASANSYTRSWAYGGTFSIGHASDGGGMFSTTDTFVVSNVNPANGDAILIFNKSTLVIGGKFLVIENPSLTNGFHVKPGGGAYYLTATLPTFSGTSPTNKFKIGSTIASSLGSTGVRDTNSSAEMVPGDV